MRQRARLAPGVGGLLAGLLVQRVGPVPAAELLHLDPLAVVQLVLGRDVVPPLAHLAGQGDLDPLLVLRHVPSLPQPGCTRSFSAPRAGPGVVAAAGLEPATTRL